MRWIAQLDELSPGGLEPLIWTVRLDSAATQEVISKLWATPEDLAFAAQSRSSDAHQGRLARRLLLKALAARDLGVSAEQVRTTREAFGAPMVVAPEPRYASTAGRGPWAVLAVSRRPIGVDLETSPPEQPCPVGLLHPAEQQMLAGLSGAARDSAFLRLWTMKEAYAKAAGLALEQVLQEVRLELEADRATLLGAPASVSLRQLSGVVIAAVSSPRPVASHR